MELTIKGAFLGATKRKNKDGTKEYADLHMAVEQRQSEGATGMTAYQVRMNPAMYGQCAKLAKFAPVAVVVEESEYTREGGAVETVKVAIGFEALAKAA